MGKPHYHFEDFDPGEKVTLEPITVDEQEMVAFARDYDPQLFHLDPEAAANTMLGGLAASGWYVCVIAVRALTAQLMSGDSFLGSPGIDEVRWTAPVRANDVLGGTVTIVEKRALGSKPGVGVLKLRVELENQNGEPVYLQINSIFVKMRRPNP